MNKKQNFNQNLDDNRPTTPRPKITPVSQKGSLPRKEENPEGLHAKYMVTKADGRPVPPEADYFVLRLDEWCRDPNHLRACREAVRKYADEIEPHIPELAADIRKRWRSLKE